MPQTFSKYSYYENITQVYKRELHLNFKTFSQLYNIKILWKHFSVILIVHFDPFFTFYILFNLDHGLPSKNSRISEGETLRYTIHFNMVNKINKNIHWVRNFYICNLNFYPILIKNDTKEITSCHYCILYEYEFWFNEVNSIFVVIMYSLRLHDSVYIVE